MTRLTKVSVAVGFFCGYQDVVVWTLYGKRNRFYGFFALFFVGFQMPL